MNAKEKRIPVDKISDYCDEEIEAQWTLDSWEEHPENFISNLPQFTNPTIT